MQSLVLWWWPCQASDAPEPESFFARMERSMLAADAERVVVKGEMTEEEKEVAKREAQARQAKWQKDGKRVHVIFNELQCCLNPST